MPRFRTCLAGIAAGLLLACGSPSGPTSSTSPTPSPTVAPTTTSGGGSAPWPLNLDLSGDVAAHVTGTAASDATVRNECTGPSSARLGKWASTFILDIAQARYQLVILVADYRSAATFTSGVSVELATPDQARVWQNGPGDAVSFTVGPDERSGLLVATLSNAATPAQKVTVNGHWTCLP